MKKKYLIFVVLVLAALIVGLAAYNYNQPMPQAAAVIAKPCQTPQVAAGQVLSTNASIHTGRQVMPPPPATQTVEQTCYKTLTLKNIDGAGIYWLPDGVNVQNVQSVQLNGEQTKGYALTANNCIDVFNSRPDSIVTVTIN
jgi:hypothetical protein